MAGKLALAFLGGAVIAVTAGQAGADVRMTSRSSGAAGLPPGETTLFIKGLRMRIDGARPGGVKTTLLYDLGRREIIVLDAQAKQARVYPIVKNPPDPGSPAASVTFTPTGQSRVVLGKTCQGYDVKLVAPVRLEMAGTAKTVRIGGRGAAVLVPVTLTHTISGRYWIAPGVKGGTDYAGFWNAVVAQDLALERPSQLPMRHRLVRAITRFNQHVAALAGLEMASESRTEIVAEPVAPNPDVEVDTAAMNHSWSQSSVVTSVSTDPLDDRLFAVPEGFTAVREEEAPAARATPPPSAVEPEDDPSDAQAVEWYRPAAARGDVKAMSALALAYYLGRGVEQDYAVALGWARKAAEKGDVVAQRVLGSMYCEGKGAPKDAGQGAGWYRRAAESGDANSQLWLGRLYESGLCVGKDLAEAARWYREAAERNAPGAAANLERVRSELAKSRR